jgi:uncharacterized protein YndB with AHSA1/START domain
MHEPNGNVVEQTIRIAARPETVWKYWTDPERMRAWWGERADLDPRSGGICRVEMGGGPVMRGEYLELEPYRRLVFSFGWEPTHGAPDVPPASSRVEVTLVDEDGDTVLTLRHSGIPDSATDLHATGWSRHLPMLRSVAGSATDRYVR